MTECSGNHPVNVICKSRRCYLSDRNPYLRLLRRLDRAERELRQVREWAAKRGQ